MQVEIDPHSGFCGGVIRAIGTAEAFLDAGTGRLYSLGAIVHNEEELSRLEGRGLRAVGKDVLGTPAGPGAGETVLIRAHGEPPQVYARLQALGLRVIDCTCPVVLGLQQKIREAFARVAPAGGQVVLFGKIGHPEVLGLVGQVEPGGVIVVENVEQLHARLADGSVRADHAIELFSQTTMSPEGYAAVRECLQGITPDQPGFRHPAHGRPASQAAAELLHHPEGPPFDSPHHIQVERVGKARRVLLRRVSGWVIIIGNEVQPPEFPVKIRHVLRKPYVGGHRNPGTSLPDDVRLPPDKINHTVGGEAAVVQHKSRVQPG